MRRQVCAKASSLARKPRQCNLHGIRTRASSSKLQSSPTVPEVSEKRADEIDKGKGIVEGWQLDLRIFTTQSHIKSVPSPSFRSKDPGNSLVQPTEIAVESVCVCKTQAHGSGEVTTSDISVAGIMVRLCS